MEILRTPDHRFAHLTDYPYAAHYTNVKTHDGANLRIHHIDEGPKDAPILLCMHGQPVWSYVYSKMIPHLVGAGIRVIAPDLPGYGKSDKPAAREDYSYQRQVDWMNQWLIKNQLRNLSFFGQDWGGLIGLRMIADHGERFDRVAIGNTGLPYNPNVSASTIERINAFRADPKKITLFSMMKRMRKMNGFERDSGIDLFAYWQKYTWETADVPAGLIASSMIERRNRLSMALELTLIRLGLDSISPFKTPISKAFEAPYPSTAYKMAVRAMPSQVPTIPDASLNAQQQAWEFFESFEKPFLCVGSGNDPVTNGFEKIWFKKVPGCRDQAHCNIGGGHFLQWSKAQTLSRILSDFMLQK